MSVLIVLAMSNLLIFCTHSNLDLVFKILVAFIICTLYSFLLMGKGKALTDSPRLNKLKKGADLLKTGGYCTVIQFVLMTIYLNKSTESIPSKILNVLYCLFIIAYVLFCGIITVAKDSKQIKLKDYILMLILWYIPIVNVFPIYKFYRIAKREYIFESDRLELENSRSENEICRTKYPVLMVHGIFFRDWQLFNYWGRVPAVLKRNGAEVFYGNQQSAQSIESSARELCTAIEDTIKKTGAEKVNIIAHSKGGLDSRYAISCLGMDKYVATLTTINTPHKGCDMVDYLLEKLPIGAVKFIEKKYNGIFAVLGDKAPDFLSGVKDLSAEKARDYDRKFPDSPDVSYRSFMSVMNGAKSAGFPLNIGYRLIKRLNGANNDGLVWEQSAKHGDYRLVSTKNKRGISHGDVIDLFRENIDGYDVREFYVEIISSLKSQGY